MKTVSLFCACLLPTRPAKILQKKSAVWEISATFAVYPVGVIQIEKGSGALEKDFDCRGRFTFESDIGI